MTRTVNNCSLIKKAIRQGAGTCGTENGKCIGYASVADHDNDEPCEQCKECKFNVWYGEE